MASSKSSKYVYFFGGKKADGKAEMKALLGGKGANLAEMVNIGIPVPAGFTISTEVCTYYYQNKNTYPKELKNQVFDSLKKVEKAIKGITGKKSAVVGRDLDSGVRRRAAPPRSRRNPGTDQVATEGQRRQVAACTAGSPGRRRS